MECIHFRSPGHRTRRQVSRMIRFCLKSGRIEKYTSHAHAFPITPLFTIIILFWQFFAQTEEQRNEDRSETVK